MKSSHIIYIPGLGDGFDPIRKTGLLLWRRRNIRVTHVAMHWLDTDDTYEQKLARVRAAAQNYPDHRIVFVGESAGGPVALAALRQNAASDTLAVTVCGMNQGAANVSPRVYERNHAFRRAMNEADRIVATLSEREKASLLTIYSSRDTVVRPRDTLLDGVQAHDIKVPQHNLAILSVLLWRYRQILRFIKNPAHVSER